MNRDVERMANEQRCRQTDREISGDGDRIDGEQRCGQTDK
jgi:hypothetical protein